MGVSFVSFESQMRNYAGFPPTTTIIFHPVHYFTWNCWFLSWLHRMEIEFHSQKTYERINWLVWNNTRYLIIKILLQLVDWGRFYGPQIQSQSSPWKVRIRARRRGGIRTCFTDLKSKVLHEKFPFQGRWGILWDLKSKSYSNLNTPFHSWQIIQLKRVEPKYPLVKQNFKLTAI